MRLTAPQPPFQGPGGVCSPSVGAGKSCLSESTGQTALSPSASAAKAKSSVPEPTKEGEGKEDKQKAAEALGLLNVRQLVRPLGGAGNARHARPACSMRQPMFAHDVSFWFMSDACKWKLLPHQMHPPKGTPFTPLPASVANLIVCQRLIVTWIVGYLFSKVDETPVLDSEVVSLHTSVGL